MVADNAPLSNNDDDYTPEAIARLTGVTPALSAQDFLDETPPLSIDDPSLDFTRATTPLQQTLVGMNLHAAWPDWSPETRLAFIKNKIDPAFWLDEDWVDAIAAFRHNDLEWGRLVVRAQRGFVSKDLFIAGIDWYLKQQTAPDTPAHTNGHAPASPADDAAENCTTDPPWTETLLRNKSGTAQQTINNFLLAIQHLEPWHSTDCWYDSVRERHMVGTARVKEGDDTAAGAVIERGTGIRVTNLALVGRALDYVCRQTSRDLLQEWVAALPVVEVSALLTTWLRTYANVHETVSEAYAADVSRIIPVSTIARILNPGCQYRYVPILEGPENAGKSKLTKALAGQDAYGRSWHVALSAGLESKEAHMMLDGALVAELEELSSYTKTDENRMKALITAEVDSFVPKFANKRVDHPRRTIFIATVNPEGDGGYLKGQAGNTRFLPIHVGTVNIPGFLAIRTQLFAEAKAYYLAHPDDWWKLDCEADAASEREERRQASVYEGPQLQAWLGRLTPALCTWQEVAEQHLLIPKERWNKALQMEIGKALKAHHWRRGRNTGQRYWVPE